jgi:hypothetical protein
MDHLPEIPYLWIETALLGFVVLALAAIHLWRVLRAELRPRECVFCGASVASDDHAHHLEICGLKTLLAHKKPPQKAGDAGGGKLIESSSK